MGQIDRIAHRSYRVQGWVLLLAVALGACSIDRSAIAPASIDALPAYVCACEPSAVSWRCAEFDDEYRCDSLAITPSNPLLEVTADASEPAGTRQFSEICETTTFTLDTAYEGQSSTDAATITVIDEGTPDLIDAAFGGHCVGGVIAWSNVELKEKLSGCIAILNTCNTSGYNLEITGEDGRNTRLAAGTCTAELNGTPTNFSVRRPAEYFPPPGTCGATVTARPESFTVNFAVACSRDLETCGH